MNEKWEKEAFVGVRRVKIGENKFSATGENQKSAKIDFPNIGKQEIGEKRLSQYWEE